MATKMAACSVPHARRSMVWKQATNHQGRWSTMSFLTHFQDTRTAKLFASYTIYHLAYRYYILMYCLTHFFKLKKHIYTIYVIFLYLKGSEHPNPGKPFTARGFPRHCYLPDSEKGRKVFCFVIIATILHSVSTSKLKLFIYIYRC